MTQDSKKFVIVIPSYKNSQWCVKNIMSALDQNYTNYRIIFTDDYSPDDTYDKVAEVVKKSDKAHLVQLIKNTERLGALHNLYNMIYSCQDDEIILTLDGDDWLADNEVLNKLNEYYAGNDIWMTYGQYQNSHDGAIGVSSQIPDHIINSGSFRQYRWCSSHLRTFYAWLFKKIRKEDLMRNDKFFSMTWDLCILFPLLEMAGNHSQFISDILYIYNTENPINDHKVNLKLQHTLDYEIRHKPRYPKTEPYELLGEKLPPLFYEIKPAPTTQLISPIHMLKIGLMMFATGNDNQKLAALIESANKYFIKGSSNISYYIFCDQIPQIKTGRQVIYLPVEKNANKTERFKYFSNYTAKLFHQNYLYYIDIDCLFAERVDAGIIGDMVGTINCDANAELEDNVKSCLYIEPSKHRHYLSSFSGGKVDHYLHLSKYCSEMIQRDVDSGIQSKHHETSAMNRYFYDYKPNITLSSSSNKEAIIKGK